MNKIFRCLGFSKKSNEICSSELQNTTNDKDSDNSDKSTKSEDLTISIDDLSLYNDKPKKKYRKKNIPATVKRLVWNTYIGEEIGKTKCLCCKVTDITQMSFHCGHLIAESNKGETAVYNLRPICQNCNSSMGTKNMDEFMNKLKLTNDSMK